ncbi:GAF domain-containing protein [Leptolyngbyaceae cyanobacterium CCMR0082]|uniref:histidine kinase n=1 Tax=Adonisia turfae CCMR0082 TaxID=2304604 RepID=A0A6M0S4X1_9CYAN|nr:GAF domain-containing protein [Adonisia turfae]NEZ63001.1 GAF domain-containing protein [Adonisia turfae CCMR0082]
MPDNTEIEFKAFQERLFDSINRVEESVLKLFELDATLESICAEIQALFDFDFASLSLISPERDTIESLYGTGIANRWAGQFKHYLEQEEGLRDILADVAKKDQAEVISGWDNRFDDWSYKHYRHDSLVRIFVPIILFQDHRGELIENWIDRCEWEVTHIEKQDGQHTTCRVVLPNDLSGNSHPSNDKHRRLVLGVMEAGYENCHTKIEIAQVKALFKLVSQRARNVWESQFPCVLKVIAESAMQILQADASGLYFLYEPDGSRYIFEALAGNVSRHFHRKCTPRPNGLGRRALQLGTYKFIPDFSKGHISEEIMRSNRPVYDEGVKAMAAFPLIVRHDAEKRYGKKNREGVLYVDYHQEHIFTDEELRWGELFANRAVDAVRHAMTYEHINNKARQLAAVHAVAQSFTHVEDPVELLPHIAWYSLNVLAADIVTIYEYIETEHRFLVPPAIAGRLKVKQTHKDILRHNVPFKLIEHGENIYIPSFDKETMFFEDSPFSKRQGIQSLAAILLKVRRETVGVMFINYRRPHWFSEDEVQIIETLASSAAIAIKNQGRLVRAQAMATLGDLAAPMVHKINNDVGAIHTWAKTLQDQCSDERNKRNARRIVSRASKILQGTQRLNSWIQQRPKPLSLKKIIDEAIVRVNISDSIDIDLDIPQNLSAVLAGEQQLIDVFDNLIQNAVDAMAPDNGNLFIRAISLNSLYRNGDRWIEIHVSDTGKGIEKENYENIFQAGFGSNNTKNKRGMGFGLWWTRAYIERVGGDINVVSKIGEGTTFIVRLPTSNTEQEV